jgi:tetratricopeptide (TPR) repeat protein
MAYLLLELGDHGLMIDLLEVLSQFPPADLDVDSVGHLALARALLLYQVGDAPASYAQATAAVVELKRRGAANLVTMQLQCGIGSLLSCQGKYDAAMASFKEALGMANRLGNDPQVARLCGNIALCYGRLGHYAEQLEWALKVGALRGPSFMGFLDIQVAYSQSFALVMLGRPQEALKTLEEMDARLANPMAAWQIKAWSLWKADILQLAGRTAEALEAARSAVTDLSFGLETPAFAGPFARWLQSTDSRVPTKAVGAKLAEMISNLERYDTLDQAEILCAYRLHAGDRFTGDLWVQLESKLCLLPQPVTTQLTSLGALPTH